MGVGGQDHASAALPPGKIRYPLYKRQGGLQDQCYRLREISTLNRASIPGPSVLSQMSYTGPPIA